MVGTDLSPADIAAVTGNKNNDGNAWGGNGAWLWLIVLLLFCGWGGNGWGNRGNANIGAYDNYVLSSDFATLQRQIDSATASLAHKGDATQQGLCDGFYAMNTTLLNGFAGVNQNMNNGFQTAELSRANQQRRAQKQRDDFFHAASPFFCQRPASIFREASSFICRTEQTQTTRVSTSAAGCAR